MITDEELVDKFNYWLDHYTNNGDKHYSDTRDWKIQELYTDLIYDRVLNNIAEEGGTEDELIERLSNLT
jgi:hypothetical protein